MKGSVANWKQSTMTPVDNTLSNFIKWTKTRNHCRRSEDISEIRTVKSKLVLSAFVDSIIRTHKKELIASNGVECTKLAHNCLFIGLRQCYELNLQSWIVVSELIREIFLCEGNLYSIFSILTEGHVTRGFPVISGSTLHPNTFTLYPNASSKNFDETVLPAMSYYLQNIVTLEKDCREKGSHNYHPSSLLNSPLGSDHSVTPLLAATKRKNPELVLLLLRYGANPTVAIETDEYLPGVNPIQYIVTCLNRSTSLSLCCLLERYQCSDVKSEKEKCCKILSYFKRSIHHIDLRVSNSLRGENEDANAYYLHPKLASLVMDSDVPSLQHLCRGSVRKRLAETSSYSIPQSIKHLPVPFLLQEFLDLKT